MIGSGPGKTFKNVAPGASTHPIRVFIDLHPSSSLFRANMAGAYAQPGTCPDLVSAQIETV
jgi:hypothetical protein